MMRARARPRRGGARDSGAVSAQAELPRAIFFPLLGAIIALALIARIYRIDRSEIWLDEAFSFHVATLPDWSASLARDNTPPLHYLLLRLWLGIAGSSEAALRTLSALAGTAAVAALAAAGRILFDRRVALAAGAIAAVSPIHVYYSQEARPYALLTVLLAASIAALARARSRNRAVDWSFVGVLFLAALYTHYLSVFALAAAAALVHFGSKPVRWRPFFAAAAAAAACFAPWVIWTMTRASSSRMGVAWIRNMWEQTPPAMAIPRSLEVFALGNQAGLLPLWTKQLSAVEFPPLLRLIGLGALVVLVVVLAGGRARDPRVRALAVVLLAPLAALWLISFVQPLYVAGRYDMIAWAAFPMLAGAALEMLRRRHGALVAAATACALLVPMIAKLALYYGADVGEQAKPTAQLLASSVGGDDAVVFTGLRGLPVLYYLDRAGYRCDGGYCRSVSAGVAFYCRMYPRRTEETPAAADPSRRPLAPGEVASEVDDFTGRLGQRGVLWVAFESGEIVQGRLRVPEIDAQLVRELTRRGFKHDVSGAVGSWLVVPFRRS